MSESLKMEIVTEFGRLRLFSLRSKIDKIINEWVYVICMQSFIKIGEGVPVLIGTERQHFCSQYEASGCFSLRSKIDHKKTSDFGVSIIPKDSSIYI